MTEIENTSKKFIELWHQKRAEKKSILVAGLDPATSAMRESEESLPKDTDKATWCKKYVESVAPYVVAIKPNLAYFQGEHDRVLLNEIISLAHQLGLLVICDSKISDIGSTNDAWMYFDTLSGFDATTIAPYAGNIEGTITTAHKRGIAAISMGLMSNPEFMSEALFTDPVSRKALWQSRVERAIVSGITGLVVGGTYTKESKEFMNFVALTQASDCLYLVPGIGFQGGTIENFFASGIDPKRCMINVGRSLMFPKGRNSTSEDQAEAAKELQAQIQAFSN
jgi:orotidine-5'-phosphate decarboxylase